MPDFPFSLTITYCAADHNHIRLASMRTVPTAAAKRFTQYTRTVLLLGVEFHIQGRSAKLLTTEGSTVGSLCSTQQHKSMARRTTRQATTRRCRKNVKPYNAKRNSATDMCNSVTRFQP